MIDSNGNEIYGIIYKITNKINNKVYIGQTIRKGGFDARYGCGTGNIKFTHNVHLKRSIEKYGIENFEVEKEFDKAYSQEELNEKEIYWIKFYDSINPEHGYNKKSGGENGRLNGETRIKIMEHSKCGINPVYCITTNEILLSAEETSRRYGIGDASIRKQCNNEYKENKVLYSKTFDLDVDFKWLKDVKGIPIILLNTMQTFKNQKDFECYVKHTYNVVQKSSVRDMLKMSEKRKKNPSNIARYNIITEDGVKDIVFMRLYDYIYDNYDLFLNENGYDSLHYVNIK